MLGGDNLDGIAAVVKANTVSADTQAKLRRFDALKAFHIAFLGLNEARQPVQDTHRGLLIKGADISLGLFDPGDLFWPSLLVRAVRLRWQWRAAHPLEVIHGEAELGQHFLVRYGFVVL